MQSELKILPHTDIFMNNISFCEYGEFCPLGRVFYACTLCLELRYAQAEGHAPGPHHRKMIFRVNRTESTDLYEHILYSLSSRANQIYALSRKTDFHTILLDIQLCSNAYTFK